MQLIRLSFFSELFFFYPYYLLCPHLGRWPLLITDFHAEILMKEAVLRSLNLRKIQDLKKAAIVDFIDSLMKQIETENEENRLLEAQGIALRRQGKFSLSCTSAGSPKKY